MSGEGYIYMTNRFNAQYDVGPFLISDEKVSVEAIILQGGLCFNRADVDTRGIDEVAIIGRSMYVFT